MASNKSADELVNLLNDLFGRFDYLCGKCCLEKISTLGMVQNIFFYNNNNNFYNNFIIYNIE